ncbi:MAG: helix-turn-helix domain-containing protein [Bacteroidota bacterium]
MEVVTIAKAIGAPTMESLNDSNIKYSNQNTAEVNPSYSNHFCKLITIAFFLLFAPTISNATPDSNDVLSLINVSSNKITEDNQAVDWLLNVYKIGIQSPAMLTNETCNADKKIATDYINKEAIELLARAEICKSRGEHEKAVEYTRKSIHLLEDNAINTIPNKQLRSFAYASFARFSKYTKANDGLEYAYKSLEIAKEAGFSFGAIRAYNQIGILIGSFQKDYRLALENFNRAKQLLPAVEPAYRDILEPFVLCNSAMAWSRMGEIQKSIDYFLAALENEEIHHNAELLIGIYNNLGTNFFDLKKYDQSKHYLHKTLDLMKTHQMTNHQGIPLLRLGLIALNKEDSKVAKQYANAIDNWLQKNNFVGNHQVSFYEFKSKIAKSSEEFEKAIHWMEKAAQEQELHNQNVSSQRILKFEEERKLKEFRQEKAILEKERELQKAIIENQNIYLRFIGTIAILSLVFLILFYKKNQNLTEAYDFIIKNKKQLQRSGAISDSTEPVKSEKKIDEVLKQKIQVALEKEKLYLRTNLTLKEFADFIQSNTSYVSKTINDGFGKNFSALINEYRVREVQIFFDEGLHQTYTIESLYQKAGFKSKSSFQKAFKTNTGVTATHYLNHIK